MFPYLTSLTSPLRQGKVLPTPRAGVELSCRTRSAASHGRTRASSERSTRKTKGSRTKRVGQHYGALRRFGTPSLRHRVREHIYIILYVYYIYIYYSIYYIYLYIDKQAMSMTGLAVLLAIYPAFDNKAVDSCTG